MELQELLRAREERVQYQYELLSTYKLPLICYTMNIPGPTKNSPLITEAFLLGERQILDRFPNIIYSDHRILDTGCEGSYVLREDPAYIKSLCMEMESQPPLGRILDLDVLAPDGEKLSRGNPRPCLLCMEDARICRRRGSHPIEDVAGQATALLRQALDADLANRVGSLAVRSLLYELLTTPKPGLVDQRNNGSHKDMDPFTFAASAAALAPFFTQWCLEGSLHRDLSPPELFQKLRPHGREAEATMYRATGGINTHKGAIFSLGLMCAAAGRLGSLSSPEALCAEAAAMVQGITDRELRSLEPHAAQTKGEQLYLSHSLSGIRGQAEKGFPSVLHIGIPTLKKGYELGLSRHRAGCAALLNMLAKEADTALISRSSLERYEALRRELETLLQATPYPTEDQLKAMDDRFIAENLSPGGCADLLALCYFLTEADRENFSS